ncbi:YlcI/YnfO family protein [Mangrovibacter phragmitis]|uniref:YlcI/YnfO family protein n=1 Tax=Mangrovibacter phragmitis TaxID=1691903 RepID=UPI0035158ABA
MPPEAASVFGYEKRQVSSPWSAQVPHEIAEAVETLKENDESTGQFVVSALEHEIKRRQRKKAKESSEK